MDIDYLIEEEEGTIYHELGHVFGYCLSNKSTATTLGEISKIEIGISQNFVYPKTRLYHVENAMVEREIITQNTANIDRTLAWFIEVISGCTFQVVFENQFFKNCYGPEKWKIGNIDFCNMSVIRNISSFTWTFDDIFNLQSDYEKFLKDNQIIDKIKFLVDEIIINLKNTSNYQLEIIDNDLEKIIHKTNSIITQKILDEYLQLIEKYKQIVASH